jgi:hypothetical protein
MSADRPPGFRLDAFTGRLVELSGEGAGATLSLAISLVVMAQSQQMNAAWVTLSPTAPFFAPDLLEAGLDPDALPIVLAPSALHAGRAATHLLRSGAFALIILDLVPTADPDLPLPLLSRLVGLAHTHGTALVALTSKPTDAPSLGSLVSLHASTRRRRLPSDEALRLGLDPGHLHFEVRLDALKDKRNGPGWAHTEVFRAPPGLR